MTQTLPYRAPAPEPDRPAGDVTLSVRRGRLVVRFSGEIDTALREQFVRVLGAARPGAGAVDVDCRDVTFFCAEGVRMLMLLLPSAGGPGVVGFESCSWVDRALRLCGVDRYPFLPRT